MKKTIILSVLILSLTVLPTQQSHAIVWKVITEAIKKVIRAMDLQVQRIQNQTINLQNIQKELENILSKIKLKEIAEWSNKQKQQYQNYFDELWKVKAILTYYSLFQDLTKKQKQLFAEYQNAINATVNNKFLTASELEYSCSVFTNIIQNSISSVNFVINITHSFTVQMTDAERLKIIQDTNEKLSDQITSLRSFANQNKIISLQRAKNLAEINSIKKLYE